ncbi:hypothetical protein ABFT23_16600 [Nocardioides sp. C4-1]|uniref:hypothetical protein n=1 Tax=Nocardioides sp. C4-1 TaxID=3151851 RepID=UPI0032670929
MRLAPTVLVVVLAAAGLAACGEEDRFEAYCDVVATEAPRIAEALDRDDGASGLLPALPSFERLGEAAPGDIADDWSVIVQRLDTLADALEDAGVDPSDYDPTDPPDGVTDEQQEAIRLGAGSVGTEAVQEALANVQQQSLDVCGQALVPPG